MENISQNANNIAQAELEKFRTKLLTSPRTEQLYHDIFVNVVWCDGHQESLRKPDYIFDDSSDCEERHQPNVLLSLSFTPLGRSSQYQHSILIRGVFLL